MNVQKTSWGFRQGNSDDEIMKHLRDEMAASIAVLIRRAKASYRF
jgi:hypothetical protein